VGFKSTTADHGCILVYNTCSNNSAYINGKGVGIEASDSDNHLIAYNTCNNNDSVGSVWHAIGIEARDYCTIIHNVCSGQDCNVEYAQATGIFCGGGCLVQGNTCNNNAGTFPAGQGSSGVGIFCYSDQGGGIVRDNLCFYHRGTFGQVSKGIGIWMGTSGHSLIEGNSCTGNTGPENRGYGILVVGDYNVIRGNRLGGNLRSMRLAGDYNYHSANIYPSGETFVITGTGNVSGNNPTPNTGW